MDSIGPIRSGRCCIVGCVIWNWVNITTAILPLIPVILLLIVQTFIEIFSFKQVPLKRLRKFIIQIQGGRWWIMGIGEDRLNSLLIYLWNKIFLRCKRCKEMLAQAKLTQSSEKPVEENILYKSLNRKFRTTKLC